MIIHSFLLIGQSNMAGRGFPHEVEPIESPHLWQLRNGRWRGMEAPVNPDRPFSGVNLAESFALRYHEIHGVDVGLIPAADGGTTIRQWAPGGLLYDHAVLQARLAMRTSRLCGILWHQGESDCEEVLWPYYEEPLRAMFTALRKDLGEPRLPIVMGALGDYLAQHPTDLWYRNYPHINEALRRVADSGPNIGLAAAGGLTPNPDFLHFNARSLREFGLRYEAVYETLEPHSVGEGSDAAIEQRAEELL